MKTAYIVTGLGFGDEGKGKSVDYLSTLHDAEINVRHNGGSQAFHNVYHGTMHHAFRQIGAGSFNPRVKTILGPEMLVDPLSLLLEGEDFNKKTGGNIFNRIYVAEASYIITPFHMAVTRLRELARGDGRHGSTGKGVGEVKRTLTTSTKNISPQIKHLRLNGVLTDALYELHDYLSIEVEKLLPNLDLTNPAVKEELHRMQWDIPTLFEKLKHVYGLIVPLSTNRIKGMIESANNVVFEGAQGVLLDECHGFDPHTTWSDTTDNYAKDLISPGTQIRRYGVIRTLTTRHGAGPLPTEDESLSKVIEDPGNPTNDWQGLMRYGWLDLALLRYAIECNPIDELIVNHWDHLNVLHKNTGAGLRVSSRYLKYATVLKPNALNTTAKRQAEIFAAAQPNYVYISPTQLQAFIEAAAGVPVTIKGIGPKSSDMEINID